MNRLAHERSPYLLQHADNPVDWYPWGEEAFGRARAEDRPIFLSIGYATCHWCHVMEAECFEDAEVAALLNDSFISIKVDREERPDIDADYMSVCQALTGGGGWPLTLALTPRRRPFYAATYVPKLSSNGRMGLLELLPRIVRLWKDRRDEVLSSADAIRAELLKFSVPSSGGDGGAPDARDSGLVAAAGGSDPIAAARRRDPIAPAAENLLSEFDRVNGGFGSAPKFPMAAPYMLLLRAWRRGVPGALEAAEQGLEAMRNGGIYDQLGFGFHRYSTDSRWLVPHFEKMLCDQALLALAYLEAWQATGRELFGRTAREILEYVGRTMTSPEGAFYSAEDADSEGEEGAYYLWKREDLRKALPDSEWPSFVSRYGIENTSPGDATGSPPARPSESKNEAIVLHRSPEAPRTRGEAESHARNEGPGAAEAILFAERRKRVPPFKDDKILAGWNGLMIAAFARAGAAFDDARLLDTAVRAADFVMGDMRGPDGLLFHRFREGAAEIGAFADDYAYLAWGLLELYEAGFDLERLGGAARLADTLLARFGDEESGGFFLTADDAEEGLLGRRRQPYDGALPSFDSVALLVLLRLSALTGRRSYRERAERLIFSRPPEVERNALANAFLLCALDCALGPSFEVTITGDPGREDTKALLRALHRAFLPNATVSLRPAGKGRDLALLAPFAAPEGEGEARATAYVCGDGECALPAHEPGAMMKALGFGDESPHRSRG